MKHYVVFQLTGNHYNFSKAMQIANRDPTLISIPDDAVACYFFDSSEEIIDGKPLSGKEINRSSWYDLCPPSRVLKHYVTFLFPSDSEFFKTISQTEEVSEVNHKLLSIPNKAYAYYFFDSWEELVDGEPLSGRPYSVSSMFYIGKEYSLEEIKLYFPEYKEDIAIMEKFAYNRAIKDCKGIWHYLDDRDTVI